MKRCGVLRGHEALLGWPFLVVLIVGACLASKAEAATLRVPKDHPAIQQAVDAAGKGDKVTVAEGTYYENVVLKDGVTLEGGWDKDFSKRDVSAHVTTIDGGRKGGWVVFGANNAVLDGFTIVNGTRVETAAASTGSGVRCESTSPTIVNNTIKANSPAGVYCLSSSAVIINNFIAENEEAGIYAENGCSLKISGNVLSGNKMAGIASGGMVPSRIEARNNIVRNNGLAGIEAKAATGVLYNNIIYGNKEAGIRCVIVPLDIINNTIAGNLRSGIVIEDPSATPVIQNNVITHNGDAGIRAGGEGYSYNVLFANNNTENCDPGYLWCVRRQYGGFEDEQSYLKHNDMIADPLYVDALHHDYHLKPGSPAIDAGNPDPKFQDANFPPSLGSSRNDAGAYGGPFATAEDRMPNDPPLAHAGTSQQVYVGDTVKLNGGDSRDPNGDFISYKWELVSKPRESKAKLPDSSAAICEFNADVAGEYTAQLVVTDRWGASSNPHSVLIKTIANHRPIADAGEVLSTVYLGDTVTLYAGASKDIDGDPIRYEWGLVFKPSESRADLSDPGSISPTLVVDALGCYAVRLVVNDGKLDSEEKMVYVSTKHKAQGGKRHVPAEYPTIQSAVDAADPGDEIIVEQGVYKENIIIDKSVNLTGKGWPTIDGGSKTGDTNTIMIPYLGDQAGKIEGFIITGGGSGGLGHGINAWDSSPEIVGNRINRNSHVGVGVHGRAILTSKTKIHNNHIHDNLVGIGNGAGSRAHIFNNEIYSNRIVGVGARGSGAPRIEGNYIYGNHIGIGTREVASPYIEGNHISDNVAGITIAPVSTIRRFAGEDIVIKNNLVFQNAQAGISITSFNLSKVIIVNNTIDSNNHKYAEKDRGGGLVFGWPNPATFSAVVKNNIVSNNKLGGFVNYTGTEMFPSHGATIHNDYNNVWNNENEFVGAPPGDRDFSEDPQFVTVESVKNGGYFLSQRASGQGSDSPCVDAGDDRAANLGLSAQTTRTDNGGDTGVVDLGYHYNQKR